MLREENHATPVFYVYSDKSPWDVEQHAYTQGLEAVKCIEFRSSRHGIPFLKVALPRFINLMPEDMMRLTKKVHHPVGFTIRQVGLWRTVQGFTEQAYKAYMKRR